MICAVTHIAADADATDAAVDADAAAAKTVAVGADHCRRLRTRRVRPPADLN